MHNTLDFTGKVAIVTGAGRGIGRETALGLARRGARVLVNDYGGSRTTLSSGTPEVAQAVVDDILAAGGTAVADSASVGTSASAEAIVQHALDQFGRVDILINNAGGDADGLLAERSDAEIEGQIATLLLGPYMLIRRVWPIMTDQHFGRIVNVMSAALLGVERHAAYCAAKAGLIGLGNSAASEGATRGIAVNGVWPVAATRLNSGLGQYDEDMYARMMQFRPEQAAETMIYLSSPECGLNGEMFSVGGGRMARIAFFSGSGYVNPDISAEDVATNIERARDFTDAQLLTRASQEVARFPVK
jgi:NAD(P)-dependent dehydrogenase (short-subunit alcohol dehydrogenase family)